MLDNQHLFGDAAETTTRKKLAAANFSRR